MESRRLLAASNGMLQERYSKSRRNISNSDHFWNSSSYLRILFPDFAEVIASFHCKWRLHMCHMCEIRSKSAWLVLLVWGFVCLCALLALRQCDGTAEAKDDRRRKQIETAWIWKSEFAGCKTCKTFQVKSFDALSQTDSHLRGAHKASTRDKRHTSTPESCNLSLADEIYHIDAWNWVENGTSKHNIVQ